MKKTSRLWERIMRLSVVALLFLLAGLAVQGAEPAQKAEHLEALVPVKLDYLLFLPGNYATKEKWPLILFLHGSGERGSDLELVKVHGPPKLIEKGHRIPFIVVSPQCPMDKDWQPHELTALLDDLVKKYKVDEDRIYLTGLSMGGMGTWKLAAYTPDRFAALVPICGGGETFWTKKFAHVPTWVFHGALDQGVPLRRSQEMVDALKKNGGNVVLTVYPEAGHDAWTETYDNPALYEWLLQQKRKNPADNPKKNP
ncbi:MAG: prolyl oligopeptidase family serine peptidase [Planctomycetales bacterium]